MKDLIPTYYALASKPCMTYSKMKALDVKHKKGGSTAITGGAKSNGPYELTIICYKQ